VFGVIFAGLLAKMEYHFRRIDSRYWTKSKETEEARKKMLPEKKWRTALMLYPASFIRIYNFGL
jgi:hypothetical protein